MEKFTIGWEEWAALPKLGLPAIKIKTDTEFILDAISSGNGVKIDSSVPSILIHLYHHNIVTKSLGHQLGGLAFVDMDFVHYGRRHWMIS